MYLSLETAFCNLSWPRMHCVAQDNLKLILLPPPPKTWDYRVLHHAQPSTHISNELLEGFLPSPDQAACKVCGDGKDLSL